MIFAPNNIFFSEMWIVQDSLVEAAKEEAILVLAISGSESLM